MTTLNARANQAYRELIDKADGEWLFDLEQQSAFEEGWETGYKARQAELPTREQIEAHRMTSPGTAWRDASCACGWTGIDYWPHQTAMILALFRDSDGPS